MHAVAVDICRQSSADTGTIAQAVRPAVHDVTDGSVMRSWLNSPLSSGLESDIYKATNILNSFAQVGSMQPEKGIPAAVLQGAAGFAILSVVKVGCFAFIALLLVVEIVCK